MALAATYDQIHDAIVAKLRTTFADRNVNPRIRRPAQATEGQIITLFRDSVGNLSVIFVRLVNLTSIAVGAPLYTESITYYFEIETRRAVNETDDDDAASETLLYADIVAMQAAFDVSSLGFDAGVTTPGIQVLRPIARDGEEFFAKLCHTVIAQLAVTVADC